MDDFYPNSLSEHDIEHAAHELILKHGQNALAEAEKEIRVSNGRGNFTLSGSWVRVCSRIRQLQGVNGFDGAVNDRITSLA